MTFKKDTSVVKYYFLSLLDTLSFDQPILFFQKILMDFHI